MKSWYGFRGICYKYETTDPKDEWHNLPWKVALHIWILRRLGIKEGMCVWPPKWFEKPIRVILYPWKSIKHQCWWWFKSEV